jgi:tripartite-type tricarboxylate transporter receptor subunit TctC
MKAFFRALGLSVLALSAASTAYAAWPERPITMIVPWAAGGGTDAVARTLANGMEAELGVPVNVVNRPGGGGVIGHSELVRARPDGYTIGLATIEISTYKAAGTASFTTADVTPVALINIDSPAFNVRADSKWSTLAQALADIKAAPAGTYKLSGMAAGAGYHLALSRLLQSEGIDPLAIKVVPTQGAAPGFQELVSGGVDLVPSSLPEARALIEAGRVKSLAVLAAERNPTFPDVPTAKEAIGTTVYGGSWRAVAGPKGLPADVVRTLAAALEKTHRSPAFQKFMSDRGFGVAWRSGSELERFLEEEQAQNTALMKALGLAR